MGQQAIEQSAGQAWNDFIQSASGVMYSMSQLAIKQGMLMDNSSQCAAQYGVALRKEAAKMHVLSLLMTGFTAVVSAATVIGVGVGQYRAYSGSMQEKMVKTVGIHTQDPGTASRATMMIATGVAAGSLIGEGIVQVKKSQVAKNQDLLSEAVNGQNRQIGSKVQEGVNSTNDAATQTAEMIASYRKTFTRAISLK